MSLDWFLGPMSLTVRWLLCSLCVLGSLGLIARVVEIPAPPLWYVLLIGAILAGASLWANCPGSGW